MINFILISLSCKALQFKLLIFKNSDLIFNFKIYCRFVKSPIYLAKIENIIFKN